MSACVRLRACVCVRLRACVCVLVVVVVEVVEVEVRTRCYNGVFLHTTARLHGCTYLVWHDTWESDSPRPRHPGPQRPDGRGPKNAAKLQQTTSHRRQHANYAQLKLCVPVATEMSTDSGDELNQWHFDCRETTCRCKLQRRPQPRRNCDCGTSTNFCRVWTMRAC